MLVVAAVSLMLCLRLFSLFVSRYRSKLSFFFFFFFFFFFGGGFFWGFGFFFLSLSLSIPHSPFFSLSLPFFVDFPHNLFFISFYFFPFFFLLSLSCFLCPLVLSVTVWLSKMVKKKKKKKKKKRSSTFINQIRSKITINENIM